MTQVTGRAISAVARQPHHEAVVKRCTYGYFTVGTGYTRILLGCGLSTYTHIERCLVILLGIKRYT